MDLIWDGGELFAAGPDTRAHVTEPAPGTRITGLRFAPGYADQAHLAREVKALAGVPLGQLIRP